MNENGFFIDLVSNSSTKFYPLNKTSHFRTKLHEAIEVNNDWCVALTEIFYPLSVFNIHERVKIQLMVVTQTGKAYSKPVPLKTQNAVGIYVERGHYSSQPEILDLINEKIKKIWEDRAEYRNVSGYAPRFMPQTNHLIRLDFSYAKILTDNIIIYPSFSPANEADDIERMLGFKKNQIEKKALTIESGRTQCVAIYEADIKAGKNFIFIYTDIIRERHVGDAGAPLLRTVPLSTGKFTEIGYSDFNPPFYYDLSRCRIESIEILLCDENGQQLDFASGRVHLCLHFKPKK